MKAELKPCSFCVSMLSQASYPIEIEKCYAQTKSGLKHSKSYYFIAHVTGEHSVRMGSDSKKELANRWNQR